jgi:hypothetical protein
MRYQRTFRFAALCATLAITAPARAQAPTGATAPEAANAQADDLTHRGVDFIKKHQWAEAEALLRQAWGLRHAYDIAGNLGLAEAGLGRWREASEHLAFALETFPANGKAAHRELLREKLAKVREELGALTIVVGTAGAEVLVDGQRVGTAPLSGAVFVEAGAHSVEARLPGYVTARQGVEAVRGGALAVTLAMVAMGPQVREVPPVMVPDKGRRTSVLIAGGVTGGAALVMGAAFAVVSNARASDAVAKRDALAKSNGAAACTGASVPTACSAVPDAIRGKNAFGTAAAWSFIGAGTVGAATLIYALAAPKAAKTGRVLLAPTVTAKGGGLVIGGAW